jgi:hypothetical protein
MLDHFRQSLDQLKSGAVNLECRLSVPVSFVLRVLVFDRIIVSFSRVLVLMSWVTV